MAKSYEILRAQMSPERRAENDRETQKLLAEMALEDLRQALDLTPTQMAAALASQQTNGQSDVYVTTLRRYIEALGGHLKLVASFPDREVVINSTETVSEVVLTKLAA
jgi:hypothetical protein